MIEIEADLLASHGYGVSYTTLPVKCHRHTDETIMIIEHRRIYLHANGKVDLYAMDDPATLVESFSLRGGYSLFDNRLTDWGITPILVMCPICGEDAGQMYADVIILNLPVSIIHTSRL